MAKRKRERESTRNTKRSKTDSNSENSENSDAVSGQPQHEKRAISLQNPNVFDIKHFRKELTAKTGQTMALTQFLQVCLNPDNNIDYMLEYLKVGGNSHEILRQISQDSKKNLTLATPAFHLVHLIILKVQSSRPHMIVATEEACRYFLNTFIPTVEIMISENAGPRHRKIILNLLTSMVTLNSDLGVEILNQVPLTPKSLQHIVEKPNYKEKDNVRTAFVHFMTSFLVDGHLPLIKALLEKQGLLPLVIPGLIHDEANAVLMFLNTLKKNVIDNALVSKTLKLKSFSHQVLHNMFKLFTWKGPPEMNYEQTPTTREDIMTLVSDIILTLFTSHKLGLYFLDNSLGTSDANKNQSLYKALQTLKRPWENEHQCKIILEIVYRCPDLHRAVLNIIEQSFQPQHSPLWEKVVEFVIRLLDKLKPENMISRLTDLNPVQTANFIRFVTLPVPLLKLINTGIEMDRVISLYCIKVLVKMMQTLKRYMQLLELEDTRDKIVELKNKMEIFLPKHMPTQDTIVSLMNNVVNKNEVTETSNDYRLPKIPDSDSLQSLLDILLLNNYVQPAFIEFFAESIEMKMVLDFCMTSCCLHLKYKAVSVCQLLYTSALSINNSMFKRQLSTILEVYTSDEVSGLEAKDTLQLFFKSTDIYEYNEDEVQIMLYTLRNCNLTSVYSIAEVIEYVLKKSDEVTEYINKAHYPEFSDEFTQSSLDTLFNDLIHKSKAGSAFLATKMPSKFIFGCMHYAYRSKHLDRSLKAFLNLYTVNMLHSNYSPELTESLMCGFELDVRSYIIDWMDKPVVIPDITEDETLKYLSKSIIENQYIPLPTMFPLIESTEEIDLKVMDVTYKIVQARVIVGTDLFVWAKYLVFCLVRLTNMGLLNAEHTNKIVVYFKIIIELGKKYHLLNVCRDIVGDLFRNAHVLKIFQPINFGKNAVKVMATEALLQIIDQTQDIVNYLNKKDLILRSYQLKSISEITKAFTKINKKKNICHHLLVAVINKIGSSLEEDIAVFDLILATKIEILCSKVREVSMVYDLLRLLIEKYSRIVTMELWKVILEKCMNLYFSLLTYKEVTPNLAIVEDALVGYFDNKPHRAILITEDDFTKFFHCNTIRKSTSELASVLLKHNNNLIKVFKKEIARAEVLSQRELTLPLGNALTSHSEFFKHNRDILKLIYDHYKPNIKKFLEKPHKVGQLYINSSKFLKKVVVECMDIHDCEKIFSNSHKFETVELSHIDLLHVVFYKLSIFELKKKEYLVNYFLSVLNLTVIAIKENETHILDALSKHISNAIQISCARGAVKLKEEHGFKKITKSGTWQSFCKYALKDTIKVRTRNDDDMKKPTLLCLLTNLVKLLYPSDHEDIVNLFDMVTSHSEFLNVMLSHHSPDIKLCLLEFLFVLISTNKSVMKTEHIPVYLSAYHATRTSCDRLLLSIVQFYEANDLPVNEYKPYLWGDSAANHYAVRKSRISTLWGHPTPNQVLDLLEKDKIKHTIKMFPVNQKFDYNYEFTNDRINGGSIKNFLDRIMRDRKAKSVYNTESTINKLLSRHESCQILTIMKETDVGTQSHLDDDESIYDPLFLFPLLSHLLAPGSVVSLFKLLRSGLLSVPVMGLSSHCPLMRAAAYHVLHRFYMLLETETKHKNDKLLLTDFITTLRHSLSTAIDSPSEGELRDLKNPRLPAIGALYLAKALVVCTSPTDPLYKPVNNFLIAKQFVDLTVVPDFLSLFHDCDLEATERRIWILDVIKDGVKTITDVNVVFKTMCVKMIMDFYNSVVADKKTKLKIICVLNSMIAIPRACEILLEGYGIVSWLHFVVRNIEKGDIPCLLGVIVFIENLIYSMALNLFSAHCSKSYVEGNSKTDSLAEFRNKQDVEYEILSIVYDLLPHIEYLNIDNIVSYVKLYNLITKRSIMFLRRKQVVNVVMVCSEQIKRLDTIKYVREALSTNNCTVLNSKVLEKEIITSEERLRNELQCLVQTYMYTE